jgi:hypothetical protein
MRLTAALLLAATAPTLALSPGATRVDSFPLPGVPTTAPGRDLPVIREHKYRMAGKIRVLLLWVGKDDVGDAVIKWRGSADAHAFELLIGADPQRAPGQMNKWGYLVEESRNGNTSTVGLISQEPAEKLSDVRAGLAAPADQRAFDTVRGFVTRTSGNARVGTLHAPSALTYRDADRVLADVLNDSSLALKQVARSPGVSAGFLSTLDELMDASIAGSKNSQRRPYIHGDKIYELRLVHATRHTRFVRDGRVFHDVVQSRFETKEVGDRTGTRFDLVYGASGALTGIPVVISYQPKWWLHVDLVFTS